MCRGSDTPVAQGAVPNFGVPFYLYVHPLSHNYQICRGNTHGRELVFRGQPRPTPRGRVRIGLANFGVPFRLYMHPLSRNYQIRHGNIRGEGRVFWVQPRPYPKKAESRAPQFWGFSCIYAHTFNAERPNSAG